MGENIGRNVSLLICLLKHQSQDFEVLKLSSILQILTKKSRVYADLSPSTNDIILTEIQSFSKFKRIIHLLSLTCVFTGSQIRLNTQSSVLKPEDGPLCPEGSYTRKTKVISRIADSPSCTI